MNKFTLRQIECFLEVCRDFSFTRAATRLNLAQPPLSRHIRELEQVLGCKLFDRTSRQVSLTEAGHAFLEQVCTLPQMLNRASDAAQRAQQGENSQLKIGFVSAILNHQIYECFREFRSSHPTVRLELTEDSPKELVQKLKESELHGAFLGVEIPSLPKGLQQIRWKSEPLYLCRPQGQTAISEDPISLKVLQNQPFVTLSAKAAPSYCNFIEKLLRKHKVAINTVQEVDSVSALLSLVIAGSGIALLSKSTFVAAKEYLTIQPIEEPDAVLKEVFVYRTGDLPILSPFLELVTKE